MKKILKSIFNKFYSILNYYPVRLTDYKEIKHLIDKLKPVRFSKGLIRFGPNGDGGYLIPDDLDEIYACFSPGIGPVTGFEEDCLKRGINAFLADYSVENVNNPQFNFIKKYIGVVNDDKTILMEDWVKFMIPTIDKDLILQMDIEGCEYEVLLSMPNELLKRFRIIIIEFHSLEQLLNRPFFNIVTKVFDKILENHVCVHNHPNNCSGTIKYKRIEIPLVSELTFIRKDRINSNEYEKEFPNILDYNTTTNKTIILPKCWYE